MYSTSEILLNASRPMDGERLVPLERTTNLVPTRESRSETLIDRAGKAQEGNITLV